MATDRASFQSCRRVVVKIGSRLLADDTQGRVASLAEQARKLSDRDIATTIVTSGAIALGMRRLKLPTRPREIPALQAVAAVGQGHLIQAYEHALSAHDLVAAQVLLTHDDVSDRRRYLNARHALNELIARRAIPIINENDTVSVDEIKFGDNDRLAALVTSLIEADLLVILTDVDGLYDGDPRTPGAKLITEVRDIDREAAGVAGGTVSGVGTGGMASKVAAARIAGQFGVPTVILSGREDRPIERVLAGEVLGTVFWPSVSRLQSRKHWIAYALRPQGIVIVDAGARKALETAGKSLLPSGIKRIEGRFGTGEAVSIVDEIGVEFARGLVSYDADEVARIAGKKSADIEGILGYRSVEEVIHRDDLVLLTKR